MNPRIPHQKVVMVVRASIISKSEVSIMLRYLLGSIRYTVVQIKNFSKHTSVIKVATMKIIDNSSVTWRKPSCVLLNQHISLSATMNGTQMRATVSLWRMHCIYVLQYVKRHFLGWSGVEQWKIQARSLSFYRVTLVWRHQSVTDSVTQSFSRKFC